MQPRIHATSFIRTVGATSMLLVGFILARVGVCGEIAAPEVPEQTGLRLNRFATKTPEALAPKAGGPTERIEVQSTEDHIDYVVKTYELEKGNASEVYQLILNAVQLEGGYVDRIAPGSVVECEDCDSPVQYTYSGKSLLVVTAPEWMIPYLDQTISILDRQDINASEFGTGAIFLSPKHRRPSEIAAFVAESAASGVEVLVHDDSRNILYMEDSPSYFEGNLHAINTFDRPASQIDARVRIFEIDEANSRDVGLDWEAWKKSVNGGGLLLNWEAPSGSYNLDLQSFSGDLSFSPVLATEFLNHLVSRGHAKVVSDSRLTLVNAEPGTVYAVRRIPFLVRESEHSHGASRNKEDADSGANSPYSFQMFTEGITVEIVPTIAQRTLELTINATVSSHVGYTPADGVPILSESKVATKVVLEDSEPAVLGGLTRIGTVDETTGVPGLRSVPGLKYLFSRQIKREHKSQVLVTVRPMRSKAGERQDIGETEALPAE